MQLANRCGKNEKLKRHSKINKILTHRLLICVEKIANKSIR